jgi:putative flippase GtrA
VCYNGAVAISALAARPGLAQFAKFCIVGITSTVIDFGGLNLLHYRFGLPIAIAATFSFLVAVANGFYWNRRWTFRAVEQDPKKQYPKFLLTNCIGWVLNLSIMTGMLLLAARIGLMHTDRAPAEIVSLIATGQGKQEFHWMALNGAKAVSTVIVMAWNYTAARFWTFKK